MITNKNQACFTKKSGCGLQEEVLFFQKPTDPKSNLTLTPTPIHSKLALVVNDYYLKCAQLK